MATIFDVDQLTNRIQTELKIEVRRQVSKIADKAAEDVRRQINAQADQIAVRMMAEYSIVRNMDSVTIHVRKIQEGGAK